MRVSLFSTNFTVDYYNRNPSIVSNGSLGLYYIVQEERMKLLPSF